MPLEDCKNSRYNCGPISSSNCTSYEGEYDSLIKKSDLPCDANISDVFKLLSTKILSLSTAINSLITITNQQAIIISELETKNAELEIKLDNLQASDISVTLDLGCMKSESSDCEIDTNTYSLINILQLYKNKLCP